MGEILVHEFVTADGVADAPVWTADYAFDDEMNDAVAGITKRCGAILLGRTTYQEFEEPWSSRGDGEDPLASFFNESAKHVVSGTLGETTWRNSSVLGAYDPDAIRALKERTDGDLFVAGSGTLVRALLADGLVDELNLFLYPLTRGEGPRLFPAEPLTMSLASCHAFHHGVLHVTYRL